jgi:hypothetical protein
MSSLSPECGAILQPAAAYTQVPCLCATSLVDMAALLATYSRRDFAGLLDLLARGKAISLAEGVELHILSREVRLAGVRIESGTHIGQRCWISAGLIGDRIAH